MGSYPAHMNGNASIPPFTTTAMTSAITLDPNQSHRIAPAWIKIGAVVEASTRLAGPRTHPFELYGRKRERESRGGRVKVVWVALGRGKP